MAKLVNEFILQAFKEELRCLKSELRMSHKVQINSSPQSAAQLEWEAIVTTRVGVGVSGRLSLPRFQWPRRKDSEKTGQQEAKRIFS